MVSRGFNPEGLIAESQSKISVFDAQIAELQSLRSVERNKIGKLRYLSSPLSVLPLEMLSEIFKHSVASGLHLRQPPAVHLSEVCQYWRQVTNSLPWLWSELRIEVDENPQKAYLEAVRAWLARSAQLPLSIALTLDLEDTQTHSVVIDEIVAVKSRLATLHILNCVYAPVLGSLIEGPLPALRTLRFEDSVEVPSPNGPYRRSSSTHCGLPRRFPRPVHQCPVAPTHIPQILRHARGWTL
ncbi:hypothetical protein C8R46DRAFT_1084745 [Mycena filopes]|nr:hypothetical protein C8R46DRAFT_1084745 [Mycena filopes]